MLQRCPKCGRVMRIDDAQASNLIACTSCSHTFSPRSEVAGRVTLTRTHLKMPEIEEFVVILVDIASHGVLEYETGQSRNTRNTETGQSHINTYLTGQASALHEAKKKYAKCWTDPFSFSAWRTLWVQAKNTLPWLAAIRYGNRI